MNSRKTSKRNSELFPSCLTQEVSSVTRSQRASVLSSQTLLTILNVEPLYLLPRLRTKAVSLNTAS
ncbi:hypothetical protein C0W93_14705 [Photobacterium leiognathi subsp. mandapamensis]|uniref:Uncharacterized protein n=1 Tax=Photobacterium leiognathi subsp. mandapamensis TaxID=48408 RepID=A0A2T3KT12_PHOLD|nr:hypothetical protein C0W93_14705 [Photobacterium leiognathi subsp. mandapamensis]